MARYTQLNHKTRIKQQYRDLFSRVVSFKLSHKQYLEYRSKIQSTNSYKRLTNYNRDYIRGMEELFLDQLTGHYFGQKPPIVFCYDIDGVRYDTTTKEYKAISPCRVNTDHTFKGHCWKDDTSRVWYQHTMITAGQPKPLSERNYTNAQVTKRI